MMTKIATTKGTWKMYGINVISSDSIYQKVKAAIESGNLSEEHLQKETGHKLPININMQKREIAFSNF